MALPLLFTRKTPTTITRKVGTNETKIFLDVLTKETFGGAADPSQHPVEAGADITDHIVVKPKTLSISGVISLTPLGDSAAIARSAIVAASAGVASSFGASLGKFGAALGGAAGAVGGVVVGKSIAASVYGAAERDLGSLAEEFVKMRDARDVVSILTGLRKYDGYALSSFSISRDEKSGGSFRVDLEFKEILRATSRIASIEIPKVVGAIKPKNVGRQSTATLDAEKAEKGKSLAKRIFGS